MYQPFERQGSVPLATYVKLDKIVIEQNDVSIQFLEGYLLDGNFVSLGADHINMTPFIYNQMLDAKSALISKLAEIDILTPIVEEST